jgi:hypothetical protein
MTTEHEKDQPHSVPGHPGHTSSAGSPPPQPPSSQPVREADPKDSNPNLIPPEKAGDQLPGEPPGVHVKGEAGAAEEVEKKEEAKK